jgi:hypothetical protein
MDMITLDEARLTRLYEMRTDVHRKWTLAEQAAEMGVSESTIKRMARSPQFLDVVKRLTPARSPMIDAASDYLAEDLLPLAMRETKSLLENPRTPATAKANLITQIFRYAFEVMKPLDGSTAEVLAGMDFLKQAGISLQQVNIIVQQAPPEFADELRALLPFVDGELVQDIGHEEVGGA